MVTHRASASLSSEHCTEDSRRDVVCDAGAKGHETHKDDFPRHSVGVAHITNTAYKRRRDRREGYGYILYIHTNRENDIYIYKERGRASERGREKRRIVYLVHIARASAARKLVTRDGSRQWGGRCLKEKIQLKASHQWW